MMKKYNVWEADDGCMLAFLESGDENGEQTLPDDAKVVLTVEAESYEDAQNQMRRVFGMEPYRPMDEAEIDG